VDGVAWLEGAEMTYKGVEYTVVKTANTDVWKWQFQIGESVKTGKTETKIELLARRRTELQINRALVLRH
jgi:hypothetical protein